MKRLRSPDRLPILNVHIRWLIRADAPEVLRIEQASYGDEAFDDAALCAALRQYHVVGQVAETGDDRIAGFMIYRLKKRSIEMLALAVDPACRRRRVATQMIAKLSSKLSRSLRSRLTFDVPDGDLAGHLLLRACGFKARKVIRGGGGDRYRFELAPFNEEQPHD